MKTLLSCLEIKPRSNISQEPPTRTRQPSCLSNSVPYVLISEMSLWKIFLMHEMNTSLLPAAFFWFLFLSLNSWTPTASPHYPPHLYFLPSFSFTSLSPTFPSFKCSVFPPAQEPLLNQIESPWKQVHSLQHPGTRFSCRGETGSGGAARLFLNEYELERAFRRRTLRRGRKRGARRPDDLSILISV